MDKACRVGVAAAGNQLMVAVAGGVSVNRIAVGVAISAFNGEQDVKIQLIARSEGNERRSVAVAPRRHNLLIRLGRLSFDTVSRNASRTVRTPRRGDRPPRNIIAAE